MAKQASVFDTKQRIRLGVWGLGRGLNFYEACAAMHLDVVAGCDFNAHMRERFRQMNPEAMVTDNAEEFLAGDFDAVLLATYCPNHAEDTIRCIAAGKHVLAEVTAFHTMAEGVRLVEAVEKSGLVYNLAENYGYTAQHMCLARKWKEGIFGDLMYAEGEYVHEVRSLAYTFGDGVPIQPGNMLHQWRSWLPFHYYCTHSLGPVMFITGLRPTRVVALPATPKLDGFPPTPDGGLGTMAPSLINLSNGSVFRNLMGGSTSDTHLFRYWGSKGAAEVDHGLRLRLGGTGGAPMIAVKADWGELTPLAQKMGHGGGDFFVLYYFARQILFGEPSPFDLYPATDVTIPGLLAWRSAKENGKAYDVPDFREKRDRDVWRYDHLGPQRYPVEKGCFPRHADTRLIGEFTTIMRDLMQYGYPYRHFVDWYALRKDAADTAAIVNAADETVKTFPALVKATKQARYLVNAYPRSDGADMLRDMLAFVQEDVILKPQFFETLKRMRRQVTAMQRRTKRT